MHTTLRNKRIEVLAKIDALKDKCHCQTAEESKSCANCKELNALGQQLTELVQMKKIGVLGVTINKDIHSKDFNFKVPQLKERKNTVIDWSKHHEILSENSKHFTLKEMAKKLGVSAKNLKNYYDRKNLKFKPEMYEGKKYNYFINDELIAIGSIKGISEQTGKHEHTLRTWIKRRGRNGERLVEIE